MSIKARELIKSYKIIKKNVKLYICFFFFTGDRSDFETVEHSCWGICPKNVNSQKSLNIFAKKALPQTFDWVLNTALNNTIKKQPLKRYFPNYVKLFVSLFLTCILNIFILNIFFFVTKIKKRVTKRNKRLNLYFAQTQ